jgi:pSer/pThr/pTyr-binding forkhead associated (FHA) protein
VQAQLVVLKGQATKKIFAITGDCTNIGRLAEVTDRDNRVVRRNQVVFVESEDEANRTVSRAQAHIRLVPPGEYRLHDDRSSHGTRVFRDGRTIEIPSGSPRGVRLRPGDEIYFGQACVRFEIKDVAGSRLHP